VKELEERLVRLQADFENYKKRTAKENEALRENANADILLKLLPVVDDFDMAMAHLDEHKGASSAEFVRGMELIYAKLKDTLKRDGVEEMRALGEKFDPYRHDAVRQGEGDEGKITEVVQKGYTLRGKVLRHAKVVVGKGKEAK
jgi:molecular chaperone GrpE